MLDRVDIKTIAEVLSVSKQAAAKRSAKEGWPFAEVSHPGGKKRMYAVAELPAVVREAILRHHLKAPQVATPEIQKVAAVTVNTEQIAL